MSGILKGNILSPGQLEQLIYQALTNIEKDIQQNYQNKFESGILSDYAKRRFSQEISNAVAQGVAIGVQKYLKDVVKTVNQPTLEGTGGLDNPHIHPNIPLFDLQAP